MNFFQQAYPVRILQKCWSWRDELKEQKTGPGISRGAAAEQNKCLGA